MLRLQTTLNLGEKINRLLTTLRFFVEIQLVERGFMESVKNVDWWKAAFGGKYDSWKVENL